MGRASSSKKVAKAAAAGRKGRVSKDRSLGFPAAIAAVVVVGVGFVVAADRDQANADDTPPQAGLDHWHTAFGIFDCDAFLPDLTNQNDPVGIHTHADGVIHIHPFLSKAAGENARLDDFFEATDLDVSDDSVRLPDGEGGNELVNGADCNGEPGVLRLLVWDSPDDTEPDVVTSDFGSTRFSADGQVMALVLAPEGAEIPMPESVAKLQDLSLLDDVYPEEPSDGTTGTTVAGDGSTATTVAGDGSTATTVAGEGATDTTVAATPASDTTTATTSAP